MDKFRLIEQLNEIIDQGKFIRNILVHNETAELEHVKQYIIELNEIMDEINKETK